MKYRKLRNTKEEVSILGFGCMRFPTVTLDELDDQGNKKVIIDEEEATKMLRYAIDNGLNYVDTAWPYHGGLSEPFVGRALQDGYREKVKLATKLPSWLIKSKEDMHHYLDEQLKKLQTDYIDFYLIHTLNQDFWKNLQEHHLFDFIEEAKASGKIKHIGFSFHDELPLFKEIVDAYPWSFTQIQFNIIDHDYQAGLEGLKYAYDKGLDIIIMEPLRGGSIVGDIPEDIKALWAQAERERSPVEWALKYLWNYEEVGIVLSGMSEMDHVKDNMLYAGRAEANELTKDELDLIYKVKEKYLSKIKVHCTDCKYCMPCPHGVDIPGAFKRYNEANMFDRFDEMKSAYQRFMPEEKRASACIACGECEPKCPQAIPIINALEEVKASLEA